MVIDGRGTAFLVDHVLAFCTAKALYPVMQKRVVEFSRDCECAEAHEPSQVATDLKISKMPGDGHFWAAAQQMPKRFPVFLEDDVLAPVGQMQAALSPRDFTDHQK